MKEKIQAFPAKWELRMIEWLRRGRIHRRLTLGFIFTSVISIILIGAFCAFSSYRASKKSALEYSANLTEQITSSISDDFNTYIKLIENISVNPTVIRGLDEYHTAPLEKKQQIENELRLLVENNLSYGFDSKIESAELYSANGEKFYFTSPITKGGSEGYDASYILSQCKQEGLLCFLSSKEVREEDKEYIILSQRCVRGTGDFAGAITIALNKEYVEKICFENIGNTMENILLLDKNNEAVATSDTSLTKGDIASIANQFSSYDSSSNEIHHMALRNNDLDAIVSYRTIPGIDWKICSIIPYAYLMENSTKQMILIFSIVIVLILFALVLAYLFTRSIVQPVENLMEAMEHTDTKTRILDDSKDEHALVIEGFNQMNQSINRTIEKVYTSKLQQSSLNSLKKEAELSALQQQINPHFLYNTLESMYWDGQLEGEEELSDMVTALGNYLRAIINKGREYITIHREMESIDNYLFLQNKRFNDRIGHIWEIPDSLQDQKIIKLLLLPVVEEIITTCLDLTDGSFRIIAAAKQEKGTLTFTLLGNAVQIYQSNPVKRETSSYLSGIANVKERLHLYYGEDYGIWENMDTYKVSIRVPMGQER